DQLGQRNGEGLLLNEPTLRKRLRQAGVLATIDATRQRLTVRRTLRGAQHEVLHLHANTLSAGPPSKPSKPSNDAAPDPSAKRQTGRKMAGRLGRSRNRPAATVHCDRPSAGPSVREPGPDRTVWTVWPVDGTGGAEVARDDPAEVVDLLRP